MLDSTRKKNTKSCKLALQAHFRFQKKIKKKLFFQTSPQIRDNFNFRRHHKQVIVLTSDVTTNA